MLYGGWYGDLRRSEGIAETPALSEGQLFSYVVALASEPSTVRVLAIWKKLSIVADSSCAKTALANSAMYVDGRIIEELEMRK
jgi:hypothetical protein